MSGPSNAEFFQFLGEQLSFSLFRRSPGALMSFKETIEFVFVPEGTAEGPEEGLLFEGTAPLSYDQWRDFVAAFAILEVESHREPDGSARRVYRAQEIDSTPAPLASSRAPAADGAASDGQIREELVAGRGRYVWSGRRDAGSPGRVEVHARRIACRGADAGRPARLLFAEKLRLYAKQHAS